MSFPIHPLKNEQNQAIWIRFESWKRAELAVKNGKTPADMVISQTRSAVQRFESVCQDWESMTPEIIEQVTKLPDSLVFHCIISSCYVLVTCDIVDSFYDFLPEY